MHGWMDDGNAKSGVKQSRRYPERTERRASPSSASASASSRGPLTNKNSCLVLVSRDGRPGR